MILGILLLVTIASVSGQTCTSVASDFTTCMANIISPDPCTCWNNFKGQATKYCTGTDVSNVYAQCAIAKVGCSSVDCTSAFNPSDCTDTITALPLCVYQAVGDKSAQCNCLNNFISTTNKYCSSAENILLQVATCKGMEEELGCGVDCSISNSYCNLIDQLIPACQNNYSSCAQDDCTCYDAFTGCMEAFNTCSGAQQSTIKACVEKQFGCVSIQGHCDDDISTSVSLTDLDELFNQYTDKFINLWNNRLANWTASIQTCTHTVSSTLVTWKLGVSFNATKYHIHDILTAVIDEFSNTIGVKATQLSGSVLSSSSKRDLQQNTGNLQVTAQGNGSSMISIFLLPIILFNGLLFLFFN